MWWQRSLHSHRCRLSTMFAQNSAFDLLLNQSTDLLEIKVQMCVFVYLATLLLEK